MIQDRVDTLRVQQQCFTYGFLFLDLGLLSALLSRLRLLPPSTIAAHKNGLCNC